MTANGSWSEVTTALRQTDQPGYGTNNNSGSDQAKAAMGMPYEIPEDNALNLGYGGVWMMITET